MIKAHQLTKRSLEVAFIDLKYLFEVQTDLVIIRGMCIQGKSTKMSISSLRRIFNILGKVLALEWKSSVVHKVYSLDHRWSAISANVVRELQEKIIFFCELKINCTFLLLRNMQSFRPPNIWFDFTGKNLSGKQTHNQF